MKKSSEIRHDLYDYLESIGVNLTDHHDKIKEILIYHTDARLAELEEQTKELRSAVHNQALREQQYLSKNKHTQKQSGASESNKNTPSKVQSGASESNKNTPKIEPPKSMFTIPKNVRKLYK